jgi:hypothetical protein
MALKYLTSSKSVKFPSCHAMTKNVTKLARWLCETISKNTTNQGDRAGGVVVLVVDLTCAASEALYLQWFLCGGMFSGGAAEIVMVGES